MKIKCDCGALALPGEGHIALDGEGGSHSFFTCDRVRKRTLAGPSSETPPPAKLPELADPHCKRCQGFGLDDGNPGSCGDPDCCGSIFTRRCECITLKLGRMIYDLRLFSDETFVEVYQMVEKKIKEKKIEENI